MEDMKQSGLRERIQKFGRFLSGMVMPNIGAFIAWGIITALFIPTGWMPNEQLSALVGPMILYMLPILIGFTGGQLVGGKRGGVIGAIATMGVVVGVDIPMFIGAMIMGPVGGFAIKKTDEFFEDKVPAGFEMLVANFSAGIVGMVLALVSFLAIGPVVLAVNTFLGNGVGVIVEMGLLPLASVLIEPAKVLFLNNAINHGVLGPLGVQETAELGKSIFFLLETNPGPGLGILLAYWVFAKGMVKQSAPGAIIIHFLGGIHEIYFPYILMKPILTLAAIAGGMSGVFTFALFGVGLSATPSPGSIIALLALTPRGNFLGVIAGVTVSTVVSFLVASFFIRGDKGTEEDFEAAKEQVVTLKAKKKDTISTIVFACDAGMGSSAMGASILGRKLKEKGIDMKIKNESVDSISPDADLVISYKTLEDRVRSSAPNADYIGIDDFIDKAVYEEIVADIIGQYNLKPSVVEEVKPSGVLMKSNILIGLASESKEDAIKRAGQTLVDSGYVGDNYIPGMLAREEKFTTYIGNHVAIPHGENAVKDSIKESGLVVLQYPEGVDFGDGNIAYILVGIAGKGDEHITLLANIAEAIEDPAVVESLKLTNDKDYIYQLFAQEEM